MNNQTTLRHLACLAALACGAALSPAWAQQAPAPSSVTPVSAPAAAPAAPTSSDLNYGLLGENYTGLRFSYDHHTNSPPRAQRRYGFVSNMAYDRGIDTAFNYDFREGSAGGSNYQWNNVGAAVTGFLTDLGAVRPFATGSVGWRWQKIGTARDNSFAYLLGGGAEVAVAPRLGVAPYVNYQSAPHLHEHGWRYGANATYRFSRAWSALAGLETDEHSNLAYTFGANRHF